MRDQPATSAIPCGGLRRVGPDQRTTGLRVKNYPTQHRQHWADTRKRSVRFSPFLLPNTDSDEVLARHRNPSDGAIFLMHRDEVPLQRRPLFGSQ